jgi:hypothetical protein
MCELAWQVLAIDMQLHIGGKGAVHTNVSGHNNWHFD